MSSTVYSQSESKTLYYSRGHFLIVNRASLKFEENILTKVENRLPEISGLNIEQEIEDFESDKTLQYQYIHHKDIIKEKLGLQLD